MGWLDLVRFPYSNSKFFDEIYSFFVHQKLLSMIRHCKRKLDAKNTFEATMLMSVQLVVHDQQLINKAANDLSVTAASPLSLMVVSTCPMYCFNLQVADRGKLRQLFQLGSFTCLQQNCF